MKPSRPRTISVPIITPFVSTTLTVSTGYGTITRSSFFTRRLGDSLEAYGSFRAGTTAVALAYFDVPLSLSLDTTKLTAEVQAQHLGRGNIVTSGGGVQIYSTNQGVVGFWDGADAVKIFWSPTTQANVIEKQNVNAIMTSTDNFTFSYLIPILGWRSHEIIRV